MDETKRRWLRNKKQQLEQRLAKVQGGRAPRGSGPEMSAQAIRYDVAERASAIPCGGIGDVARVHPHPELDDAHYEEDEHGYHDDGLDRGVAAIASGSTCSPAPRLDSCILVRHVKCGFSDRGRWRSSCRSSEILVRLPWARARMGMGFFS